MTEPALPLYTDQQKAAILTRGVSIALSAGAGCGKTFVLTQRFLTGLEPGTVTTTLRSMVAITFTDKASREMRDRIRSACHQRLQQCSSETMGYWLDVLRGLDAARISTIHSFCTGILRSQAVDAGLDPRFSVLEPALSDTLLRNTARDTLYQLLEQADPDIEEFVLHFNLEGTHNLAQSLVGQRFQINFTEFENLSADVIAARWRSRWTDEFVPKLLADFRAAPPTRRLMELLRDNEPAHPTMQERRAALLYMLDGSREWPDPQQALQTIVENARVQQAGRGESWPSPEIYEAVKNTLKIVRDEANDLSEELMFEEEDLKLAAEFSVRALRLARSAGAAFDAAKQAQGLLDYDDLLLRTRDLLRDRPDVRDRVADGIRLLMVDEFQDTDPVQADIVRMLCGDALTQGRLFLVGDAKQSIYRFRRADPTVFDRLRTEIPEKGRLPLNVNFRSQPAILDFVNHLFSAAMGASYEALEPFEKIQRSPTPAIEFLFATHDVAPSGGGHAQTTSDRPKASELRTREADWIARRCAELLADPTPRIRDTDRDGQPTLRRVRAGDIVVLFRALSNISDYESALRKYGLDYYLVGGRTFFAQQEIFDLLNLCRYLNDPDDLIGLIGLLRSPFFNLSDDSIQALAFSSGADRNTPRPTLHDCLQQPAPAFLPEEQRQRIEFARDLLHELRSRKDRVPLATLLTLAVERTGYDASLLTEREMGSRKIANLRKLIDMARQFDRIELFTLNDFVERLQTSVMNEADEEFATTLPETGEVVRLMSVHQSKGLEFPVVIVADIDRKGPPRGRQATLHPEFGAVVKIPESMGQKHENLAIKMISRMESDADDEETTRLFYVACTRAEDYLILSAGIDPSNRKHSPWFQLVESRFDTTTGLPKSDPLLGSSAGGTAGREKIPEIRVHHQPPQARPSSHSAERLVPIPQLVDVLRIAEPTEIPELARRLIRDVGELPPLSVSRLETIDADLHGIGHVRDDRIRDLTETLLDLDQATALGSLVHAVLELIDFKHIAAWPQLLDRIADCSRDHLNEETINMARQMLSRLMTSDIVLQIAEATSLLREMEFNLRWPTAGRSGLIRGVIDVLYADSSGGWHVLDYKTNDFPAHASEEQLLAPYELQLGIYGHAVTEWFGEPPRELSLVVFRPTVRKIVLPWSNARWQALTARIDSAIAACRIP